MNPSSSTPPRPLIPPRLNGPGTAPPSHGRGGGGNWGEYVFLTIVAALALLYLSYVVHAGTAW